MRALTIASLRIYFDQADAALFEPATETRAVVETKLGEYRDFIEKWLDASEENRPRWVTEEERELRKILRTLAKDLKRLDFDKTTIEIVLQKAAATIGKRTPRLTQRQLSESVAEVLANL
jgi:hypothetical protein